MAKRINFPPNTAPSLEDFDREEIWELRPDVKAQDPEAPGNEGKTGMTAFSWWNRFGRDELGFAPLKDSVPKDKYKFQGFESRSEAPGRGSEPLRDNKEEPTKLSSKGGENALQEMMEGRRQPNLKTFRDAAGSNVPMGDVLRGYQAALRQWRENRSIPVYDVRTGKQRMQNIDTYDNKTAIPLDEFGKQVTLQQAIHNRQQVTGFSLKSDDTGVLKPFTGQPGGTPPSGQKPVPEAPKTPEAPKSPESPKTPESPKAPGTTTPSEDADIEDKFNFELGLKAIDDALKAGQITAEQAAGFRAVLESWNPGDDINVENILTKFNDIQNSTINPEFKNIVTATALDFFNAKEAQARANAIELSEEAFSAGQRIRQARGDLERRGLTFGGEAIRQLGPLAAIGQEATGIPGQQALTGPPQAGETFLESPLGLFQEGNVNFQNRLISSSSALRRQQAAQDLARKAESTLGSTAARGLGLDATLAGGQKGSIEQARLETLGSTLSGLIGQARTNTAQGNPLDLTIK